ncbi:MAG: ABC transporter permease, partial [Chloroflexota bacterium]
MSTTISELSPAQSIRPERTPMQTFLGQLRSSPITIVGLVIVVVWIVLALLAPAIAPKDPLEQAVVDRLQAPSSTYLMGSDELGRDVFSRVLYGGRITMPAAFVVVLVVSIIGTIIGALAGYLGGWWDEIMMRFTELFMAFPTIILAMAVTAALG